jgi:hypothetical protein
MASTGLVVSALTTLVGAEFGGHRELVVFDGHGHDEPACDAGVLQCEVAKSAAEDCDRLSGSERSAYGTGGTAGCSSKKRMSSALASGPRGSV